MNARKKAKSDMFQVVEQVCDDNPEIIAEIVAFQTAVNKFKALIAQILETEQSRSMPSTGITLDKSADRAKLCKMVANIAGLIFAYASANKNETLKAEVNYSPSKFLQMREDRIIYNSQNIHDLSVTNIAALKDYGITAEKLTDLQSAIDAFKTSMVKPRTAQGKKMTLTHSEDALFGKADDVLTNQMDLLVTNFETTHPDFLSNYRNARKIKDPASTKTQLKGVVTKKSDGMPVKGAMVTVVELGLTTETNSLGAYKFKPIEQGEFTIKIIAAGFSDFETDEIKIKLGDVNQLNAELLSS